MYDTIIVGGGVAGLTVAAELARRGDRVLLLEKSPTLGGRVATFHGTGAERGIVYEEGAGRIFNGHARIAKLVRRYGLKTAPISTTTSWEGKEYNIFFELFAPLRTFLNTLPKELLGKHTIAELLPTAMHPILDYFPYCSEFFTLRADEALRFFTPSSTMGTQKDDYYVVIGGLDAIPKALAAEAVAAGATLTTGYAVQDVKRQGEMFEVQVEHNTAITVYKCRRVIFATCRCSLSDFAILEKAPILKQTGTAPLTRIYAVFPPDPKTGKVWFDGMQKVVTRNPLRYVIPIDPKKGLIMISYTDGKDTLHWKGLKGDALEAEIMCCTQELFPDHTIPSPTFLKKHPWGGGCTYWLPGDYDVKTASKAAHNPFPGIYITGESISTEQCWIESALESAETLLTLIK